MNIIVNTKFLYVLFLVLIVSNIKMLSDDIDHTDMSLKAQILFGASYNLTNLNNGRDANLSFCPGVRVIWNTDTKLNLGFESLHLPVSQTKMMNVETEFGATDFSADINTVPIMLIFNMDFGAIDFYGGTGISLTYSVIDSFGETSVSTMVNGSYMLAISYSISLFENIDFGVGSGFYYITDIDVFMQKMNMRLEIDIFSW